MRKRYQISRLVLSAFEGSPPHENSQANHDNGDKSDNSIYNLMWDTPSDNAQHARDVLGKCVGMNHGMAKLTDDDVRYIRKHHKLGCFEKGTRPLARQFGVSQKVIYNVVNRKSWAHV